MSETVEETGDQTGEGTTPSEEAPISPLTWVILLALAGVVAVSLIPKGGDAAFAGKDSEALLSEGRDIAMRTGEGGGVEAALPYFDKAVKLAPEDPAANGAMGRALVELNRFQEALPYLQVAHKGAPKVYDTNLYLGMCLTGLERHPEASAFLKDAIRADPNNPQPLYFLGVGAMRLGNAKDTARFLTPFVRDVPGNPVAMRILADAFDSLGKDAEAIEVLKKLVKTTPRDVPARRALQDRRLRTEGMEPVLADAAADAARENALPEDLYVHARLLAMSPDAAAETRAAFQRLKEAFPKVHQANLELAVEDLRDGEVDTARKRLKTVLAANPGNEEVRARLADLELQAGRAAEARTLYDGLLGGRYQAHAQLGIVSIHLDAGAGDEALAFVESLLADAEAGDPRRWALRGDTLKTLGRFDECKAVLDGLVKDGREQDRVIWLGYAAFLELERGDDAAARAAFDTLVEAAGADVTLPPEIQLWRGVVAEDPEKAKAFFELAASGADYDAAAAHTRAAKRLLGTANRQQLLAGARLAGYRHQNDALFFEGLALERAGDVEGAKAAYTESLDASRGDEFPARLARRALERLTN